MATSQQDSPYYSLVFGIASTGFVFGLLSCAIGLATEVEAWLWIAAFVAWIVAAVRADSKIPFVDVLLGGLLAGVLMAGVQTLMSDLYYRNNWQSLIDTHDSKLSFAAEMFPRDLKIGGVIGVLAGVVSTVIVWLRRRAKRDSLDV